MGHYSILNIFKGKIAESIFRFFCINNNIEIDWETPSTPFWTIDKRDFITNSIEWDIKNNFIYHDGDELMNYNYSDLPVLIPNRRANDQWGTKNQIKNAGICLSTSYIFSFLKSASLQNGNRGADFMELNISQEQLNFIENLEIRYNGIPTHNEPFTEEWFWTEMANRGDLNFIQLRFRPHLIITAIANHNHWGLFRDTGPFDRANNFQTYIAPRWYTKTNSGSCNFMNGTLWTTITNSTLPVSNLPSFLSLFPHLNNNINF